MALCAVAFELFELIDRDLDLVFDLWIRRLHVDPHNPIIATALGRASGIDRAALAEYGASGDMKASGSNRHPRREPAPLVGGVLPRRCRKRA